MSKKEIFENHEIFNMGTEILGVKVTRVWSRSSFLNGWLRGVKELNPYRFGDMPTSWAASLQECLMGALVSGELLSLPDSNFVGREKLRVFGAQYGELYFGREISFFIDGIYEEVEPWIGAPYPANIAIPSSLLVEFCMFARNVKLLDVCSSAVRGQYVKNLNFQSTIFPEIKISTDFNRVDPKLIVSHSLQEFELCDDGGIVDIPQSDSSRVNFGEISIPEALTIHAVTENLKKLSVDERELAIKYVKSDEIFSRRDEITIMCQGTVVFCNDIVSFILPPNFSSESCSPYCNTLPPTAIPTDKLVNFLQAM